jgi:predicted nucleic acid-binding protein
MRSSEQNNPGGLYVVQFTRDIAGRAGACRQSMERQRVELMDCIIAATAQTLPATLATCNAEHYPMTDIRMVVIAFESLETC